MGSATSKKPKNNSANEITEQDKAILELKRQTSKLHQYREKMNSIISKEKAMAKELLNAGNKQKALLIMKKKKYQEKLIANIDDQMLNLEKMVHSIEFAKISKNVFDALALGNQVLQKINSECSLEEAEKIMADTAEALEYQRSLDEILGNSLTNIDDQAISEELARMEEQENKQALDASIAALPSVPDKKIKTNKENKNKNETTVQDNVVNSQQIEEEEVAAQKELVLA